MAVQEACVEKRSDRAGGSDLIDVVSLGDIRLNAFLAHDEPDPEAYPLTLAYSPESQLVQLRHTVDPELMFRTYWYNSGTNESMREHLAGVALDAMDYVDLNSGDIVVDIGCNDGTLLSYFPHWARKIGYDPAKNLSPECDLFINDFFRPDANVSRAKIVTSIAMFYDIDDPVAFARGVYDIMHDDGVWVIEMHYLHAMLEKNEVDAICHEHLCYYSLTSLSYVLGQAGLIVVDVSFSDVNGGSMRAIVRKARRSYAPSSAMQAVMQRESRISIRDSLEIFLRGIELNRDLLPGMLRRINRITGRSVGGYGASTKGNTLLQYAGITPDLLPFIADRNPQKHGLVTVGTHISIIGEETMREISPEYLLALPYHFIDNFREREDKKFKWIVPVPSPRVLV